MIHNYTTLQRTIHSIVSKLGLREATDIPYQDITEWIAEALSYIGGYSQLEIVEDDVQVVNYKGKFPLDMHSPMELIGHEMQSKGVYFITDIQNGSVRLRYSKLPLDEDGFPKIPDSVEYLEAIMWYCAKFLAIRDLLPNKALNVEYCNQKWLMYCRKARAESATPTIDQLDRMVTIFTRNVPKVPMTSGINPKEIR